MIRRETLEAEIAELTSKVSSRVSEIRGLYAEVAGLRAEIELLKKIVDVRDRAQPPSDPVSIILLGFVSDQDDEPQAFCAVTWSGSKELPSQVRILLKTGWQSLCPPWIFQYVSDLLKDWRLLVQTQPTTLLSMIDELSVGPLRTMEEKKLPKSRATELIKETLGEVEPLPSLSMIKM